MDSCTCGEKCWSLSVISTLRVKEVEFLMWRPVKTCPPAQYCIECTSAHQTKQDFELFSIRKNYLFLLLSCIKYVELLWRNCKHKPTSLEHPVVLFPSQNLYTVPTVLLYRNCQYISRCSKKKLSHHLLGYILMASGELSGHTSSQLQGDQLYYTGTIHILCQ